MKIKIVGKIHREGTSSKSGRPYNINTLHCLGPGRGVEGQAVMTITVDGHDYPYDHFRIGGEYIADFDVSGTLIDIQAVAGNGGAK